MSSRNVNKLFSSETIPSDDSDDGFEPLFTSTEQNTVFEELSLSSHSESRHDSSDKVEEEGACALKPQKKKKKKRNKGKQLKSLADKKDKLDEVDRSVMEVNALLGTPPPLPPAPVEKPNAEPRLRLMSVQNKYLNSEYEIRLLMGEANPAEERRRRQQLQEARVFRRNVIVNLPEKTFNFHGYGLSMSIESRDGIITYFTYDHSRKYQKVHGAFLTIIRNTNINLLLSREQILGSLHIEGMLELVDTYFIMEEYEQAELMLEMIIGCLQYTAHSNFTLGNPDVRLEYKYLENRPFFTTILRYIYLLSNKSHHRTALELSKMLLNLDPSDPLKMFLIIEIVALRAFEHQWLVDLIDTIRGKEKLPEFIVSLKYSYALARFHIAYKKKGDMSEVDTLLQETILDCPYVAKAILKLLPGVPKERIEKHILFNQLATEHIGVRLVELINFYAKMIYARWREPNVLKWFLGNLNHLIDTFSPEMEATVIQNSKEQSYLSYTWPAEVVRHMTVIKAMSDLISDGAVPPVKRASASNPVPPLGSVDRYKYTKIIGRGSHMGSIWHDFFSSVLPRNVNIVNVRLFWLSLQHKHDYFINNERYFSLHLEGTPYLVVPCTLIVFSLYFILVDVSLKLIAFNDRKILFESLDDNIELD